MSTDVIATEADEYEATVETVLSALDRWTARNDGHHTEKRGARRFALRAPATITTRSAGDGRTHRVAAHTRNISVSGLAFVVPRRIDLQGEVLTATSLFSADSTVTVSLDRDQHEIRLIAKVCRLRKVHDDLYECGVMFIGRDRGGDSDLDAAPAAELALAPPEV